MLANEVLLFGMLGVLTSAFISYFVTNGKEVKSIIICSLQGAFTGWLAGMVWVYLTSGLQVNLLSLVLPVFISAFFTIVLLQKLPRGHEKPVGKGISALASLGLFALVFLVAFSSIPLAYRTIGNTTTFSIETLDYTPGASEVTTMDTSFSNRLPITIDVTKSSLSPFSMSENASVSSYLDFKVFFTSGGEWTKPYITIGVYKDTDGDGELSTGDVLWSDTDYKLATANSLWRVNCLWENNVARYGMFSSDGELLPIFHADAITSVKDEVNVRFLNTPEGFTPQNDMLTWTDGTLKEQVISYAAIAAGEASSIQGRIYCGPSTLGKNIIVAKAYCACLTEPFTDAQPITEQVVSFTVTQSADDVNVMGVGVSPTGIFIGLGVLLGIGLLYAKKTEML